MTTQKIIENNNDIRSHQRNIQALLTEVFKMKNELAPPIMESILNKRFNTYNLRNFQEFATERKRTVWYCLQTKRNIRHWTCRDCPCRLCKVYIQNREFL